jgi:glyoxylase-like metal-dependent hydrolase (beta-lactamase superfamily II)
MHERSGAPVAAIAPVAHHLAAVERELDRDEDFARALMRCHGFDDASTRAVIDVESGYRRYHHAAVVDEIVPIGGRVSAGDRELTVHLRPGHSEFDTVFHDERDGLLVAGDHLLARVASSPYLHCPAEATDPIAAADGGRAPSPLPCYIASLRATADLDATLVLPGPGPIFSGHRELIADRLDAYEARRTRMLEHLHEPRTARALITELWPRLPDDRLYLAFSETLGTLELLLRDGLVERTTGPGGPVTFCAAASSAARGPR